MSASERLNGFLGHSDTKYNTWPNQAIYIYKFNSKKVCLCSVISTIKHYLKCKPILGTGIVYADEWVMGWWFCVYLVAVSVKIMSWIIVTLCYGLIFLKAKVHGEALQWISIYCYKHNNTKHVQTFIMVPHLGFMAECSVTWSY